VRLRNDRHVYEGNQPVDTISFVFSSLQIYLILHISGI